MNTQLSSALGYNTNNVVFSKPVTSTIPGNGPPVTYKRIYISTKNSDGSIGDLVFETSRLFSFGVSENTSMDSGAVNGYSMPLCLWSKDGATDEEKEFVKTFDAVVDRCKEHLLTEKDELEKYDLELNDLKNFNPLYWKKERGKRVEGRGPTLYAKLIVQKRKDENGYDIKTNFYDSDTGETIDPSLLIGKYCSVTAAVKLESIFIGNKISLQVKLYEAEVKLYDSGTKRLLGGSGRRVTRSIQMSGSGSVSEALDSGYGSLEESEEEDYAPPSFEDAPKKVARRRVAAKK
jgi:hypothetical protein